MERQLAFCDRISSFFTQVSAVLCRFPFVVCWVLSFIKDSSEADTNYKLPKIHGVENKIKVALCHLSVSAVGYKERSYLVLSDNLLLDSLMLAANVPFVNPCVNMKEAAL